MVYILSFRCSNHAALKPGRFNMSKLSTQQNAEYIKLIHEAATEIRDYLIAQPENEKREKLLEAARYIRFACAKLDADVDYIDAT